MLGIEQIIEKFFGSNDCLIRVRYSHDSVAPDPSQEKLVRDGKLAPAKDCYNLVFNVRRSIAGQHRSFAVAELTTRFLAGAALF